MKLSIVTWNMDTWKRTHPQRKAAWTYLTMEISADIMLLQEFAPQSQTDDQYSVLYREIGGKRKWGSAVATRGLPICEVKFNNSYPGAVIAADVHLPDGGVLTVISLYGMFDEENYVTAALHRVLSDLTLLLHKDRNKRLFVIAGDYNASKQWDEVYRNQYPAHRIFFERLEDFGLVDCTMQYFQKPVQTNRHANSNFPWQNDYIHVSKKLAVNLESCEVKDDSRVRELSDHNPVIATFQFPISAAR